MIRHSSRICVTIAVAISSGIAQLHDRSLLSLLPEDTTTTGWFKADTARIYRGEDLFHLIDGGADVFFEYGFRQALALEYQNIGGESMNLEIYEMNDPGAAYGVYSIRFADGATPIDVGQEGSLHPYYVMFWKGRYYVSITGSDSTRECRKGLEYTARMVDQNIHEHGHRPPVVQLLPKEGLVKQRYCRGPLGLSMIHAFDDPHMFQSSEGVIGTYADHTTLVFQFGSAAEAEQRLTHINKYLKSNSRFRNHKHRAQILTATDNKNRVLCFGRSGALLVVSIASKESIARASCMTAMAGPR